MVTDEIMSYFFLLLWGWSSGTYRYLFIDLARVSIDDGRGEMLGYRQSGLTLAHARRTEKYKQCIQC